MTPRTAHDGETVPVDTAQRASAAEARSWLTLGVVALVGFALTTWAVASRMPIPLDGTLLDASSRLSGLVPDWRFLSASANLPLIAIGLGIVAWMFLAGRRREMTLVIVALVLATAGSEAVKILVARPRPPDADVSVLGVVYSYPSGHVLEASTIYGIIAITLWRSHLPRPIRVPVLLVLMSLVVLVGVARVALHAHYPSDVVGGALAGIGVVALYAGLTRLWAVRPAGSAAQDRGHSMAPARGPGPPSTARDPSRPDTATPA
jgi:membrane-associated phospholipid phosphatase